MRFAISLTAIAVLAACGSKKSDDAKDKPKPAVPKDKTDIPPKPIALDASQLKPVIHALGPDRSVPTSIVIELATPVMDQESIGGESSLTKFTIEPEIAGSLSFTGVSELTFTPAQPFDLATAYKLSVSEIETRDGALAKPAGESWTYEFKTPAFAFLGWAPTAVDFKAQTVTMELRFSGQVLPTAVVAAMQITL